MTTWHEYRRRLVDHWISDAKLWCCLMGIFFAVRCLFMLFFSSHMGADTGINDVVKTVIHGMRFDGRFALIGVMVTMGLSLLSFWSFADRVVRVLRKILGSVLIVGLLILSLCDLGFFYEYHEQFNQWIFGLLYDDFSAILKTIWATYPVVLLGVAAVMTCYFCVRLYLYWLRAGSYVALAQRSMRFFAFTIILGFCTGVAFTGTLNGRVLSRKNTAVVSDSFLNGLVYNPCYALYSAVRDKNKRMRQEGKGAYITQSDVENALEILYPEKKACVENIENLMTCEASGPKARTKPKHIFLIVMESQDAWPLMEKYQALDLSPNLKRMSEEGISVQPFLPAGEGTMPALSTLILGLPEVGVETQYQKFTIAEFSTSIAAQFKALGYRTNLFYGGNLNWRRLGQLAKNQGFDGVYGQESIPAEDKNEWGVDDQYLFQYIAKVCDESQGPTFNLIMTTSNHPPHTIDVYAHGFELKEIPESIQNIYDGSTPLKTLGHLWYADKCLGEFVERFEKQHPHSLFVMTGDHWSRRFLNTKPSIQESSCVPLVIYGKEVLGSYKPEESKAVGSHLDIAPTLIEMIAQKGYTYKTQGRNLFDKNHLQLSSAESVFVTVDGVYSKNDREMPMIRVADAIDKLGWWRIMEGNKKEEVKR